MIDLDSYGLFKMRVQLPVFVEELQRAIQRKDYECEANIRMTMYERYGKEVAAYDGKYYGNN